MIVEKETQHILITAKTYPTPQLRHREIVCTAGVLENGRWIRLYPIPYRYLPYNEWYKKYQWIHANIKKHRQDPRPETYSVVDAIKLGKSIGTRNKWEERKKYVLLNGTREMCWLKGQTQTKISLAVIQPRQIDDFYWEPTSKDWNQEQLAYIKQIHLFDNHTNKPLEKIPYIFKYHFHCENTGCNGHMMQVTDWELMQLFRKMRDDYGEKMALDKIKEKYLNQICSSTRDTYFFVGTVFQYGTWIIIGVFWPPKANL